MHLDHALKLEMANGYKSIIDTIVKENTQKNNKQILINSIYNTLNFFSQIILRNAQLYTSSPPNLWQEAYSLYAFSEQLKIINAKTYDSDSIESCFKQLVLFYALNPFLWRKSEQEYLYYAIKNWLPFFSVRKINNLKNTALKPTHFIVDLQSNSSPTSQQHSDANTLSTELRLLDFSKLIDHFKELIAKLEETQTQTLVESDEKHEINLSKHLLKRITHNHDKIHSRRNDRTQTSGTIKVTFGLSSTPLLFKRSTPFSKPGNIERKKTLIKHHLKLT